MVHQGSCHCGAVRFEVEGEFDSVLACNCSMCGRRGSLLWFVPREKLVVKSDESAAGTYMFNKHVIKHRFCAACGIHTWGEGTDPRTGGPMAAINVRVLDGVDLDALKVTHYDGRAK